MVAFLWASSARATIITASTGLALPELVTFEEIVVGGPGTPVTTEYAGLGITFGSGVKYDANVLAPFPGFSGHHVGNFSPITNPWSVFFGGFQTKASFALATNLRFTTITTAIGNAVSGGKQ